ncbi:MAG: lactate utilization protein, partial [Alphaproteobacteria bacterium]|nr:lactate utilization protein [Alphaproteobacteria bacterium]
GIEEAGHLPNASTFCGRCESVCPMKIPLPKLMRHWREREHAKKLSPTVYRKGLSVWAWVARRPALYHALAGTASRALGWAGQGRGRFRALPLAAGWTTVRDMPSPEGRSFHSLWAQYKKRGVAR